MRTKIAAVSTAVFGYIAWILSLPPEQQGPFFGQLIALCPPNWQSTLGSVTKAISLFSVSYALFRLRNFHPPDAQPINQNPPKP